MHLGSAPMRRTPVKYVTVTPSLSTSLPILRWVPFLLVSFSVALNPGLVLPWHTRQLDDLTINHFWLRIASPPRYETGTEHRKRINIPPHGKGLRKVWLHRIRRGEDNKCECGELQNAAHIMRCEKVGNRRGRSIQEAEQHQEWCEAVYGFLKNTKGAGTAQQKHHPARFPPGDAYPRHMPEYEYEYWFSKG